MKIIALMGILTLMSVPLNAQVRMEPSGTIEELRPRWLDLDDGSAFALMTTPDLQTTTVIRCWDHDRGSICMMSSESWLIERIPAYSVDWLEEAERPSIIVPSTDGDHCSQVLDQTTNDRSIPNCELLLEMLAIGGPMALARKSIMSIAPRKEDVPASIIRRAP